MITFENECVGCPPERGCRGSSCPNRNVPHAYCDSCERETELYEWDGYQLCLSCILKECGEDVDEDELVKSLVEVNPYD